jgi:hypothetical protein
MPSHDRRADETAPLASDLPPGLADAAPAEAQADLAGPLLAPRRALRRAAADPLGVPLRTARWSIGMSIAGLRWARRLPRIERRRADPVPVPAPPGHDDLAGDPLPVQRRDDGFGPVHHRVYRVRIAGAALTPEALLDAVAADPNAVTAREVSRWELVSGRGGMAVGDELVVHVAGPWEAPVRVIDRTPTSFSVVTLRGHMEAGENHFRTWAEGDDLVFEIEMWVRCGDLLQQLLYDHLWVAREAQTHMWTTVCERVAALAGGRVEGRIVVETRTLAEARG